MLGPIDDAHAAGPEPVEDAVIAQDQPEIAAGLKPARLVGGQQTEFDQPLEKRLRVRPAGQFFLNDPRQSFPVFEQNEIGGEQAR